MTSDEARARIVRQLGENPRAATFDELAVAVGAVLLTELVAIREAVAELRNDVGVVVSGVVAEPGPMSERDRDLVDEQTRPTRGAAG